MSDKIREEYEKWKSYDIAGIIKWTEDLWIGFEKGYKSIDKEIEELKKDRDLWKQSENTCNTLYNEQQEEIKKLKEENEKLLLDCKEYQAEMINLILQK